VQVSDGHGGTDTQAIAVAVTNVSGVTNNGTSGNDTINGTSEEDILNGANGNDQIHGLGGNDTINGGPGTDSLFGDAGNDTFVIAGIEAQSDKFDGGTGTDAILVTGSADVTLAGFNAAGSSIEAWQGNGHGIVGTGANETFDLTGLNTVTGLAFVSGGDGNDTIIGSSFADDLRGDAGNDILNGGAGNDALSGGTGNDNLTGGAGADLLTGGAGNDTFVFKTLAESSIAAPDRITDFAGNDKIDLSAIDANTGLAGDQAFHIGGGGHAGDVLATYDSATDITTINLCVNNDAAVDSTLLLTGDHHDLLGDLIA